MLKITTRRKQRFCRGLLVGTDAVIGLADVGSGGELKRPWSLLPANHVRKFDFEPTGAGGGRLPVCISNRSGRAQFLVARDERASSFHRALPEFAERFGMQSMLSDRTIEVDCTTLDRHFDGRFDAVDAIDVNVEGHDYQVLQGGAHLLQAGHVKLLKVEFELAQVWDGQGWLSDIDGLLRADGYALAGIDIDFARPVKVQRYFHRGEPLWGKALYVPGAARWNTMLERLRTGSSALEQALSKAIALYVAADLLGHAFDVIDLGAKAGVLGRLDAEGIKARIGTAYRWAKIERGVRQLAWLLTRCVGLQGGSSEA